MDGVENHCLTLSNPNQALSFLPKTNREHSHQVLTSLSLIPNAHFVEGKALKTL